MRSVAALLAAAVLLSACPSPQPLPVPVDIVDVDPTGDYPPPGGVVEVFADGSPQALASPCGKACTNLDAIGCPEGALKNCYRGCVTAATHVRVPTGCWAGARTREEARWCGLLRCVP